MITSAEVTNIYKALIKARTEITPIARTKSGASGRYRYATLDNVIELLTLILPKHGLGWIQTLSNAQTGGASLTTRIIHESGEWIEDAMNLPQTKLAGGANESQELGASITYFKRYALSAIFGIATDDDTDGVADVRERKQQVKAQARTAGGEKKDEEEAYEKAANAAIEFHSPTPTEPLPAVLPTTGDAAVDMRINELIYMTYKDHPLFSTKTKEWLFKMIGKKTPQEILNEANRAANKRMADIDKQGIA